MSPGGAGDYRLEVRSEGVDVVAGTAAAQTLRLNAKQRSSVDSAAVGGRRRHIPP